MASKELDRVSIRDWDVQSLRVTAILPVNTELNSDTWWQDIVGSQPDTSVVRSKIGERVQQGTALGGQLTLRIQPSRIDWLLNPVVPDSNDPEASSPTTAIGRFSEIYPPFSELVERWFRVGPELTRVAFGAIVSLSVQDRIQGYRQLAPYLPGVALDPAGTTDFFYRINRRRNSESRITNLQINRLSSWSVASVEFKRFQVTGEKADVIGGQPAFFCRVELDINSSADFSGLLSTEQSLLIFDELKRLGVEIIEKGDVP